MASVWIETRKKRQAVKLAGHRSPEAATELLRQWVVLYLGGHNKRSVRSYTPTDVLLIDSKGQTFGLIWVEMMSPPSAPEPGQPKRTVA